VACVGFPIYITIQTVLSLAYQNKVLNDELTRSRRVSPRLLLSLLLKINLADMVNQSYVGPVWSRRKVCRCSTSDTRSQRSSSSQREGSRGVTRSKELHANFGKCPARYIIQWRTRIGILTPLVPFLQDKELLENYHRMRDVFESLRSTLSCSLCFELFRPNEATTLECGHTMCRNCLKQWNESHIRFIISLPRLTARNADNRAGIMSRCSCWKKSSVQSTGLKG
jgi:hypothetical protein